MPEHGVTGCPWRDQATEQGPHGSIRHRATDLTVPQIDEDVIGQVPQRRRVLDDVLDVQVDGLLPGRSRSRRVSWPGTVRVIVARHDPDRPVFHRDVFVPQAQRLPDPHPGVVQQAEQESVPHMVACGDEPPDLLARQGLGQGFSRLTIRTRATGVEWAIPYKNGL
jgi:hypothetical protein